MIARADCFASLYAEQGDACNAPSNVFQSQKSRELLRDVMELFSERSGASGTTRNGCGRSKSRGPIQNGSVIPAAFDAHTCQSCDSEVTDQAPVTPRDAEIVYAKGQYETSSDIPGHLMNRRSASSERRSFSFHVVDRNISPED